jgi:hypothetical protein
MALHITYGLGGYCENCDNTHDHPLHNIIEQTEVADPEPTDQQRAKESAQAKLKALGLTDEEIQAMIGN